MVLVDTNVLLDVVEDHPQWADWSQQQLESAALNHRLIVNAVVYADYFPKLELLAPPRMIGNP